MTAHRLLRTAIAAATAAATLTATAQNSATSPLTGTVELGTRTVDLAGSATKYREDIDLDDGLRVFNVALEYRASDAAAPVDVVNFSANQLGGDPYETMALTARKYGAYRLKLDRRRSNYFYADTILPVALASVSGSTAGDLHHFDFERVRDSATLDIDVAPATRLRLGLERQTRSGDSSTTLDIQRDEFELEKPFDESLEQLSIGIEHDFERVTVIFEEVIGTYEHASEVFLAGASPGLSLSNPAELQFFSLNQAFDYDSRSHMLRAVARLGATDKDYSRLFPKIVVENS